jgi:hypothetical protein
VFEELVAEATHPHFHFLLDVKGPISKSILFPCCIVLHTYQRRFEYQASGNEQIACASESSRNIMSYEPAGVHFAPWREETHVGEAEDKVLREYLITRERKEQEVG